MTDLDDRLLSLLRRFLPALKAVILSLRVIVVIGVVGAVVGTVALILLGLDGGLAPVALLLGLIALIPAYLLWKAIDGMTPLLSLPDHLAELPRFGRGILEQLAEARNEVTAAATKPSVVGAAKAAWALKDDWEELREGPDTGPLVRSATAITPARLVLTGWLIVWVWAVVIGAALLLIAAFLL